MIEIAIRWNLVDLRDLQSWRAASNFTISLIYEPLDTLFIIFAHLGEERVQRESTAGHRDVSFRRITYLDDCDGPRR